MNTRQQSTRNPFESQFNYKALWEANLAWGIIAFAMLVLALAIWAFSSPARYQPQIEAPSNTPAVEVPAVPGA